MSESKSHRAYRKFFEADHAWALELERQFGSNAGTARYQSRGAGEPGSKLRELHDRYVEAGRLWREANGISTPKPIQFPRVAETG
jgi:hypothetical protein